ncbi:hypothetical protein SNE40_012381 [Patella caerulea]|uniref:Peptidase M12B domain-containing protein n=1 Tax=Patella caerulea TaxID=87958 RepID=A0AAN8JPS8_PATCE
MRQDIPYLCFLVVHILVLIQGCFSTHQHVDNVFLNPRQAEYVKSLDNYVVSLPSRVDETGAFIGHELHAHHLRKRSIGENEILHYKIPVGNEEIIIHVKENKKLYSKSTIVERRTNKFKNVSDSTFKHLESQGCHYSGHVVGDVNSKVAIAACDGLTGLVHTKNEEYFIEPVKDHDWRTIPQHPHIVYKRSALPAHWDIHRSSENIVKDSKEAGSCGVKDETDRAIKRRERWQKHHNNHSPRRQPKQHRRRKRSISTEKYVETLIVIDPVMTKYYQNEDLENYVLTVMNMVATIFHDATIGNAVNIAIVRIMILEDDQATLKITHHADNSLRSFCKWQKTINFPGEDHPNHHDVALLLTRHNICSRMNEPCSTLGLAQVAGLCQSHRSCNIDEDTGLALAFTIAHEIGHNFGMKHDLQDSECASPEDKQYVMAPHLVADSTPMAWSPCSRESITKFLDRDWGFCLDDEPTTNEFQYPSKPAGIMYDADHQCRLLYSEDAALCEGIEVKEVGNIFAILKY